MAEWLSWVDCSGGEMVSASIHRMSQNIAIDILHEQWYQANPHQFHLITLGTLHSLPTPVPRRSQKQYKPEFFGFLQKEKDAWEGVRATRDWLMQNEVTQVSIFLYKYLEILHLLWTKGAIGLEIRGMVEK